MATGGLAGRTTIPKVARNDPAGCHDNPPPGGAAGNRDGQDISPPREGYLKSQLKILSKYIEQIMKEDAEKVMDDYREKIKTELHGTLPDDKDVNDWMLHPEKELTLGFDTESAKSIKRAKFFRRDYNGLHDLSVLFMNAPINENCPETDCLNRDQTDGRCREFTNARDTDKVLLVAPDMPGGRDWFRTFAFKLSYENRNKIVVELSHLMQRVKADEAWDLSILYGEETLDKERPKMSQEYFKLSAGAQVNLFKTVCTEIKKFHMDIHKDRYGRELEAEDYIETVPAVQAADGEGQVTIESVTSSEEVTKVIADFMTQKGVKSKTALVVFNGHGYPNGNLCLYEGTYISQMTLLNELHKHRKNTASGVPHSIDVVWGSCYSYKGIPEQRDKEFIQVIQREIFPERDPAFRRDKLMRLERVTLVERPLRSYHLTCEDHKTTCSFIVFEDEAPARGEIKTKENLDLQKFGEKQNACSYSTGEDTGVFSREPAADLASRLEGFGLNNGEDNP